MPNPPDSHVRLQKIVDEHFSQHPFASGITKANVADLLANYLAMSQAFPYLQAGAQRDVIHACIRDNRGVPAAFEITSVVGNFLAWDETGGNYILRRFGVEGLPRILETTQNFHANHLRRDIRALLDRDVEPEFSPETRDYLLRLSEALAHDDPQVRCATMVSFELHAAQMIGALWESLVGLYAVEPDSLSYFRMHLGGADPAEPYHVAMTCEMIERLVPAREWSGFERHFVDAYRMHFDWCAEIS